MFRRHEERNDLRCRAVQRAVVSVRPPPFLQLEARAETRRDCRDPAEVMPEYVRWLKSLPGKPVFVGFPAAYDFMFTYLYLNRFAGERPFSHSAPDIKTLATAALGTGYREAVKRNMPREWFERLPQNHVALTGAIGQGILFCNALAAVRLGCRAVKQQ